MAKLDHTLIFIVEDEPSYSKALAHILDTKGFVNVRSFASGEEALDHLHLKPRIMIMDFRLGRDRMDGLQVLKILKKKNPEVQVIFLTKVDNLEIATETIKNGAYDYVVKNETAFERIKNLLRRIIFENQIKRENLLLRQSRRVILWVIFLLFVTLFIIVAAYFL
ncbi:MAG: response regulator [Bacteroidales bacterium]